MKPMPTKTLAHFLWPPTPPTTTAHAVAPTASDCRHLLPLLTAGTAVLLQVRGEAISSLGAASDPSYYLSCCLLSPLLWSSPPTAAAPAATSDHCCSSHCLQPLLLQSPPPTAVAPAAAAASLVAFNAREDTSFANAGCPTATNARACLPLDWLQAIFLYTR